MTDLTGLSASQALAKAEADIERSVGIALAKAEEVLAAHGATGDELKAELTHQWSDLMIWRAEVMAEIRTWLMPN